MIIKPLFIHKYILLVCILLIFISVIVLSNSTQARLALVNMVASLDDYERVDNISYGQHRLNTLSIFQPKSATNHAVVIFFYGGCWGGCATLEKDHYTFVAQALTSHGYMAILVDYRIYPQVKFAQIIDDAKQAVTWVKNNIDQYGGNPDSLFLMGHSAGAQLGAMLLLNESLLDRQTHKSIKGFIGLAGPYDFLPLTEPYQFAVFGPEENYAQTQPINFVSGDEAPALLLYGDSDDAVKPRNIKNLSKKIRQSGGIVETHIYNNMSHEGILAALSIPYQNSQPVLKDIIHFLNQQIN